MTNNDASSPPAVIAYGTISLDNVVRLPNMPRGYHSTSATADYYKLGGETLNVALSVSGWGHRVAVVGNELGEDAYGDFIKSELERFPNVETRWLRRNSRVRTPFSRVLVTPNDERHVIHYWRDEAAHLPLTWEMLSHARVLSTNARARAGRVEAAQMARQAGLVVVASDVVTPGHALLPLCNWIVSSRTFLEAQFPGVEPERHLRRLREESAAAFIMTDGPDAVSILTPEGEWLQIAPYPLPALDRMGAGDLFKAGIIHGILYDLSLMETVRFANAAAALWVAQPSALKQPPSLTEIQMLQEERGTRPVTPPWLQERETVCPICRRRVSSALFEKHWEMDRRVIRALRDRHPAWRRVDGACPVCVHETAQQVGLTRATANIPPELVDHPIYGQGEPQALPISVRLRANPHHHGSGVTIAFLDSGFYPHPDLTQPENRILAFVDASTENIVVGADFSTPAISSWHGMMTSVVAAGNGYLSQGYYAGLARAAKLLPIKVSNPQGRIYEHDILRGLRWLAGHWREYDVRVVNLSVGGEEGLRPDCELNQLVNHLVDEGLVVVAAAGNVGSDDLCPPASASKAITAGGLDDQNTLDPETDKMWHSNWGWLGDGTLKPEIIAPSIWVAAPVLPGTVTAEQNAILDRLHRARDKDLPDLLAGCLRELGFEPTLLDEPVEAQRLAVLQKLISNKFISPFYQHVDGTSFAAPIISSVVAQMLSANPNLTPQRVKELLIDTARPLPGVPEYQQGYGVVVPGQAVAAALHELRGPYQRGNLSPHVENGLVRFILHEPRATKASVIGEWNDWNPVVQPMSEREPGVWVSEIPRLPGGRYHYKFVVDETQWLDDPENLMKSVDGYGGFSSLLVLN
ncbi:MAG TPA: PfkB family carbohydrate kinase [Ardenticatenaceae bacterium]